MASGESQVVLWCYVQGDTTYFPISILPSKAIHYLKEDIHDKIGAACKAKELLLSAIDVHLSNEVVDRISKGKYNPPDVRPISRVHRPVSEIWPEQPPKEHLGVFIRLPHQVSSSARIDVEDTIAGNKRKRQSEEIGVTRLKKFLSESHYAIGTPSDVARSSAFRTYQHDETHRILNDRPSWDIQIVPIALLYGPFGQFFDDITNPHESDVDLDYRSLDSAVLDFAMVMSKLFKDEITRREHILRGLNKIFVCHAALSPELPSIQPGSISQGADRRTDGHVLGPDQTPEVIVEVKNEQGIGSCDPEMQLAAYYIQIHKGNLTSDHWELYEGSLLPALGITIMGTSIGFSALVMLDKLRITALTPTHTVRPYGGDSSALFQAFCAACVLRASIHKDSRSRASIHKDSESPKSPSPWLYNRNLPYVQSISAWQNENLLLDFQILGPAFQMKSQWNGNRELYVAKLKPTDTIVVVKFTRHYFPQLHSFCADRGHAPTLLGYGTVPGGWKVVVMDLIKTVDLGDEEKQISFARTHGQKWDDDMKKLVTAFHDKGWVHGDLRGANFIFPAEPEGKIMLLDFDWGGKCGTPYPVLSLNGELADGTEKRRQIITKAHDMHVLTATLAKLRNGSNMNTLHVPRSIQAFHSETLLLP